MDLGLPQLIDTFIHWPKCSIRYQSVMTIVDCQFTTTWRENTVLRQVCVKNYTWVIVVPNHVIILVLNKLEFGNMI